MIHNKKAQGLQEELVLKVLALWADAFYKLKCPSACQCVRLSVFLCLHF